MSRLIPRGHEVAGLGRRFLAFVIDSAPVLVILLALWFVLRSSAEPAVVLVSSIAAAVLVLAHGLFQWWAYATRGAGLGAHATGLQLVGLADGKPIGWWRVFLRQLIFSALVATVVGGIALVVFLIIHERRQGWHDVAVKSVLVQPKAGAEPRKSPSRGRRATTSTVGLPPHLADAFSPEANSQSAWAPRPGVQQAYSRSFGERPHPSPAPGQPSAGAPRPSDPHRSQPQHMPPYAPSQQQWQPQGQPSAPPHPHSEPSAPHPEPGLPPRTTPQAGWIPMPTPTSVLEPSQIRVRARQFGDVEENEGTTIAPLPNADSGRPGDEGWYLRLDDGREVELNVTVLLGRNPQRSDDDPEVHLVPSSGDGRMISRTHVLIDTDPRGVFIVDRDSTNGTALVTAAGELEPAPPGVQMRVRDGQQVSYGNRWFTVLRRPARQL